MKVDYLAFWARVWLCNGVFFYIIYIKCDHTVCEPKTMAASAIWIKRSPGI